ncbi:MAG TPA: hypothetical protein VG737_18865, partial [Cyclobacteriaceae bacterium]|nr:hypothetical protein [Cyclobacteriaceae bacterium]
LDPNEINIQKSATVPSTLRIRVGAGRVKNAANKAHEMTRVRTHDVPHLQIGTSSNFQIEK